MKKNILLSSLFLVFCFTISSAQTAQGCDGKRYLNDVFTAVNVNTDSFGVAKQTNGTILKLQADIYQPKSDTIKKRPLLIFAFGGGFILGARTDLADLCVAYTKKGYVCATIDYRIIDINAYGLPTDSLAVTPTIVQAQQDMRAAVRFFKKDAATVNKYGIDTSNIVVGGVSAGAITAMNVGYLSDTTTNIASWLAKIVKDQGGVEGNSGNPGYSSKVKGVVSMSGGLYQKEWINKNSIPFVAYHGTSDPVVPYAHGINVYNFYTDGDKTCYDYAKSLGVPSVLLSVPGGMHTDIYDSKGAFASNLVQWGVVATTFLKQLVCGEKINVATPTQDIVSDFKTALYPNPSHDVINLEISGMSNQSSNFSAEVFDLSGRVLKKYNAQTGSVVSINKNEIGVGLFFVRITDNIGNSVIKKIVFTN